MADALASGASVRKDVGVQVPLAHESDGRLPHALIAPTYRPFATSTDEEFPAVVQFVRWRTAICRNRGTRMM